MNYLPLNFPVKTNINFPSIDLTKDQKMHFDAEKLIPTDLYNFFYNKLNLKISKVLLFQQLPNTECNIHLDGVTGYKARSGALNFIESEPNTFMSWYDIIQPGKIYNVYVENLVITHFEEHQVSEIEKTFLQGFNIVRVDIPHKIVNNSNNVRWCLSIRFDQTPSFEELCSVFNEFKR
jgi:hypothetical protein